MLETNIDKIDWHMLSFNNSAIHLLEQNPQNIEWSALSANNAALHLLEANKEKIVWAYLARNESAIHLLQENMDKIEWDWLSYNPSIFQYDYEMMRERCMLFKEDLMKERFHPRNLIAGKFKDWGIDGFGSDSEYD